MAHGSLLWLSLSLFLCAGRAVEAGRALSGEGAGAVRALQQAQEECPDGCAENGCIFAATGGGYRCQACAGSLLVNKITGKCACAAGKWASAEDVCSDCAKGSYCPGGDYYLGTNPLNPLFNGTADEGKLAPQPIACPVGSSGSAMTTLGRRATSIRACVNMPGTYYAISTDGKTIDQITCPVNSYGPGLKKQRACVPCPTGYTTNGVTGATSIAQCVVPAGYYLKGPGQVAPCPRGEYKAGIGSDGSCTKCARGASTPTEASTSSFDCTRLLPGFYAAAMEVGAVMEARSCPQGFYCTGGQPMQPFTPESPNPDAAPSSGRRLSQETGTIFACPHGMWTPDVGATSVEKCLTPPGFFTTNDGTFPCPPGSYRPEWKPFGEATACTACGEGVKAAKTDQVTVYDIVTLQPSQLQISTSSDDCYIMPGQGLVYMTLSKTWRARNCTTNNYGVSNITYGLSPAPCRDCPANLVASNSGSYPSSAQYYVRDGDSEGFADERACVTTDGYGVVGRSAQPCDVGYWNTRGNRDACKPCPWGYTTSGVGRGTSPSSCGVAAGFGWDTVQGAVLPCPIGTYNNASFTYGNSGTCNNCSTGLTTAVEGASSVDHCNMCQPGWGGPGCQSLCGGEGGNATYGQAGRSLDTDTNCTVCTNQAIGYSFPVGKENDLFISPPISRVGAAAATDCVAKWSQLLDGAWHIPMPDDDAFSESFLNVSSFSECVDLCNYDPCEFVTYDYLTQTCVRRNGTNPVYVGAPLIAFKNMPSGDVGTNPWSADGVAGEEAADAYGLHTQAKLVSTGMYTFYREELALQVGIQESPAKYGFNVSAGLGGQFLQNCLDACDNLSRCAGITIRMNVVVEDRPTTCKLIFGRIKLGVHKRTVMRAEPLRMPLPSLDDFPDPSTAAAPP